MILFFWKMKKYIQCTTSRVGSVLRGSISGVGGSLVQALAVSDHLLEKSLNWCIYN